MIIQRYEIYHTALAGDDKPRQEIILVSAIKKPLFEIDRLLDSIIERENDQSKISSLKNLKKTINEKLELSKDVKSI